MALAAKLPVNNALAEIRRKYESTLDAANDAITDRQKKSLEWKAQSEVINNILEFRRPQQTNREPYGDDKLDAVEAERRKYWYREKLIQPATAAPAANDDDLGGFGGFGLNIGPKNVMRLLRKHLPKILGRGSIWGLAGWGVYELLNQAGAIDEVADTLSNIDFSGVETPMDALNAVMSELFGIGESDDMTVEPIQNDTQVSAPPATPAQQSSTPTSQPTAQQSATSTSQPEAVTPTAGAVTPVKEPHTSGPLTAAPVNSAFTGDPRYAPLADLIGKSEGGRYGYNALVYKYVDGKKVSGGSADLVNMTMKEVKEFQKGMRAKGHASTAVGRYQVIAGTLQGAQDALRIPDSALFNARTQDRIFTYLADQRGFKDYLDNPTEENKRKLLRQLPDEWAILKTSQGKGAFDGLVGNKGTVSQSVVDEAIVRGTVQPATQSQGVHGGSGRVDRSGTGGADYYAKPDGQGGYSGRVMRNTPTPQRSSTPTQSAPANTQPSASYRPPASPRATNPALQKAIMGDTAQYV